MMLPRGLCVVCLLTSLFSKHVLFSSHSYSFIHLLDAVNFPFWKYIVPITHLSLKTVLVL